MGSGYSISPLPCQAELSEPFAIVMSHICVSIPALVSESMMIGSSPSSMIIGFISFLSFPGVFAHNGVHVSDGLVLLALHWDLAHTRYVLA